MSETTWELSEFTTLRHAYEQLSSEADAVKSKASESPNILVYGLLCSGIIGWWMQLGQQNAQQITDEVKKVLDTVGNGVQDTHDAYAAAEKSNEEKAKDVEKIIDQVSAEVI